MMELSSAKSKAEMWQTSLSRCCERIRIAGSIRRRKTEVKDIELVAIPKPTIDLFGKPVFEKPLPVGMQLYTFQELGEIEIIKDGLRFKQFKVLVKPEPYLVDLFLVVPPAQWGSIFTIRTGSEEFSRLLVTSRFRGGYMPSHMKQKDGALWRSGEMVETPEEEDYFREIGLDWVEPEKRC
jgi:DNA polymerase/3'-5' exonuclease PolX